MEDSRTLTSPQSDAALLLGLDPCVTDLSPAEAMSRLDVAARRGRIPGLRAASAPKLFLVDGCGTPFEHHLVARATTEGGRTRLLFALERQKRMPLIFIVLLVVTVWPGVHFMDQLIPGEWNWIPTWTWYLPLTVLPVPWIWHSTSKKSRVMAEDDARKIIESIRAEISPDVTTATPSPT